MYVYIYIYVYINNSPCLEFMIYCINNTFLIYRILYKFVLTKFLHENNLRNQMMSLFYNLK